MIPCTVCGDLSEDIPCQLSSSQLWPPFGSCWNQLCLSADHGCSSCSFIKEGVLAFESQSGIINIHACNSRDRARYAFSVTISARRSKGIAQSVIEFYTTHGRFLNTWPKLPMGFHISATSSPTECLPKARQWLNYCTTQHNKQVCPANSETQLPSRVICVGSESNNLYLHESTPGENGCWAALSYCWGGTSKFQTELSSISDRKRGFSIDDLPKTCRDAVVVARSLSIPYLWIDSLCIIQDCPTDWEKEASRMCSIYENALVTFAAIDSADSNTGLFVTDPRRRTIKLDIQTQIHDGISAPIFVRQAPPYGREGFMSRRRRISGPPYCQQLGNLDRRGWTLQELTISPRILWFSATELGFSCPVSSACECSPQIANREHKPSFDDRISIYAPLGKQISFTQWMEQWYGLIEEYTQREFTVPTDRLPALSGLTSAIQKRVGSDCMAGLWKDDLSSQLMWFNTLSGYGDPESKPIMMKDDYAPSWSWGSVCARIRWYRNGNRQTIWDILDSRFMPHGTDRFGPGKGSISICGYLLHVQMDADDLVYLGSEERILICRGHQIVLDGRENCYKWESLIHRRLFVIIAELEILPDKITTGFSGLLLEPVAGIKSGFQRLGLVSYYFDRTLVDDYWKIWEQRCQRQTISLL